jgi:hypothetical protein
MAKKADAMARTADIPTAANRFLGCIAFSYLSAIGH